jgi:tRNA-intron endonuclease
VLKGVLKGDTVIISDPEEARQLYASAFYGKFIGLDKVKPEEARNTAVPLHLSILDAIYLVEQGRLAVTRSNGAPVALDELRRIMESRFNDATTVYGVYKFFRDRGFVVKSGLKFGSLFAIYEKGPGIDHAPILIHYLDPARNITALDITRAARLSHSVRKAFVLATRDIDDLFFIGFEWWNP